MIKKFFVILFLAFFVTVLTIIAINSFRNNPELLFKSLKRQIDSFQASESKTHSEWLWQKGRTFIFDVIYMNIFSPGSAKISVKEDSYFKDTPVFILEAALELNNYFNKLYDAKMVLTDAVQKDTKLALWYQEKSFTPEKEKSKEIIFDRKENIAEREGLKYKILEDTHDPLSVFFNLLDHEFKIGKPIVLNLISKEEIYEFKVTPVEFKNGIYKLKGEVYRQDRSSTHGAKFTLWVVNGKIRIPLLIKVVSAGGPIYLRLKDVK